MSDAADTMIRLRNRFYEGERPLFGLTDAELEDIRFYPGESALKHSVDIRAQC